MFYVLRFNVFFLVKSRTLCYESTFVWVLCSPNCDTKVCVAYAVLPICVNQIVEFLALKKFTCTVHKIFRLRLTYNHNMGLALTSCRGV